jgi:predicted O-methyltransferase YrrM
MNTVKEGYRLFNEERQEFYPWYTHPACTALEAMDLSGKVVYEYGIGDSSLWWAARCKKLYGVESSDEWVKNVKAKLDNAVITLAHSEDYINDIKKHKTMFDIVVIDGVWREECVEPAIASLKPGGFIIYDNWMQPSVDVQSEKVQKRLMAWRHIIFDQPDHEDWKTAFFYND